MKTNFKLIIVFMISLFSANIVSTHAGIELYLISKESVKDNFLKNNKTLDNFNIDDTTLIRFDGNIKIEAESASRKHGKRGMNNYYLLIYNSDKTTKLSTSIKDIFYIELTDGYANKEELFKVRNDELDNYYFITDLSFLGDRPRNKNIIQFKVTLNDNSPPISGFFKYYNDSELYPMSGFWVPIGLFSTDFKKHDENGILFSAQPIGFAFGNKFNSRKSYLGVSGAINYVLTPANVDDKNNIYLSDAAFAAIIDINGWIYAGYSFPFDINENKQNMFVIGIGAEFINLIKGNKSIPKVNY